MHQHGQPLPPDPPPETKLEQPRSQTETQPPAERDAASAAERGEALRDRLFAAPAAPPGGAGDGGSDRPSDDLLVRAKEIVPEHLHGYLEQAEVSDIRPSADVNEELRQASWSRQADDLAALGWSESQVEAHESKWTAESWQPPYAAGTEVIEMRLGEDQRFSRDHSAREPLRDDGTIERRGPLGAWLSPHEPDALSKRPLEVETEKALPDHRTTALGEKIDPVWKHPDHGAQRDQRVEGPARFNSTLELSQGSFVRMGQVEPSKDSPMTGAERGGQPLRDRAQVRQYQFELANERPSSAHPVDRAVNEGRLRLFGQSGDRPPEWLQ